MNPTLSVKLPDPVAKALRLLEAAGYEAYVVGGCTRDFLLGTEPKDWDITTSAFPEETKAVFSEYRTIETGIQHGTVAVILDDMQLEITTFRVDGEYTDSRHPDEVSFTRTLTEDLSRRDFTMNAICYSPKSGLVDVFGGRKDLEDRVVRCVGEPDKRFTEDALRILRALRFSSVLGFSVDPETSNAIHRLKHRVTRVATERVTEEMKKLLCGDHAEEVLRSYRDVFSVVVPELGLLTDELYEETCRRVGAAEPDEVLRLTVLLLELPEESIDRFRLSNRVRQAVLTLKEYRHYDLTPDRRDLRVALSKLGKTNLQTLIAVQTAECRASGECSPEDLDRLRTIDVTLKQLLLEKPVFRYQDLAVDGNDLIALGMAPGPAVGSELNALLQKVMADELPNDRTLLLSYLAERFLS